MTEHHAGSPTSTREQQLRAAAILYAIGLTLHTADHVRRGADTLSQGLRISGAITTALGSVAIVLVFTRHRHAAMFATLVGVPVALGTAAVHLLPTWSSYSDAFPGASDTGVTAFSWTVVLLELAGLVALGVAGALLARRRAASAAR